MSFQFRAIGLFTIPFDGILDGNISRCSSIAETLLSKNRDFEWSIIGVTENKSWVLIKFLF